MFEATRTEPCAIHLAGRLDATRAQAMDSLFQGVGETCTVHFDRLEYISSVGLSVLLATQQRLSARGAELRLRGMTPHIRMVFNLAGFDTVFDID
ncbi:MAG: STAS domain-containing protein [Rhodothermales bacterium]